MLGEGCEEQCLKDVSSTTSSENNVYPDAADCNSPCISQVHYTPDPAGFSIHGACTQVAIEVVQPTGSITRDQNGVASNVTLTFAHSRSISPPSQPHHPVLSPGHLSLPSDDTARPAGSFGKAFRGLETMDFLPEAQGSSTGLQVPTFDPPLTQGGRAEDMWPGFEDRGTPLGLIEPARDLDLYDASPLNLTLSSIPSWLVRA